MDVSEILPLVSGLFDVGRKDIGKIIIDAQSAKKKKNEFSD